MKQLFLLFLLAISTNCLGQYVFKYSTQSIVSTNLQQLEVEVIRLKLIKIT